MESDVGAAAFMECAPCRAKPGSPTLCAACLHNRALVAQLRAEIGRLQSRITGLWCEMYVRPYGQRGRGKSMSIFGGIFGKADTAAELRCPDCGASIEASADAIARLQAERETALLADIDRLTRELQAALNQVTAPREYFITISTDGLKVTTPFADDWQDIDARAGRIEIRQRKGGITR